MTGFPKEHQPDTTIPVELLNKVAIPDRSNLIPIKLATTAKVIEATERARVVAGRGVSLEHREGFFAQALKKLRSR